MSYTRDLLAFDPTEPTGPAKQWTYALDPELRVRVVRIALLREAQLLELLLGIFPEALPVARRAVTAIRASIDSPAEPSPVSTKDQHELEALFELFNEVDVTPAKLGPYADGLLELIFTVARCGGDDSIPELEYVIVRCENQSIYSAYMTLGVEDPFEGYRHPEYKPIVDQARAVGLSWFERLRAIYEQTGTIDRETALRFADEEPTYAPALRAFAERALRSPTDG